MKYSLPIILFMIVLFACGMNDEQKEEITKSDLMKQSAIAATQPSFKDPASFEFISFSVMDSITVSERKEGVNREKLNEVMEYSLPEADALKRQVQLEFDYLQKQTDGNEIAVYYAVLVAKGANSFGGEIQNSFKLVMLNDSVFTVTSVK